jgi:hypothetical protein
MLALRDRLQPLKQRRVNCLHAVEGDLERHAKQAGRRSKVVGSCCGQQVDVAREAFDDGRQLGIKARLLDAVGKFQATQDFRLLADELVDIDDREAGIKRRIDRR